MILLYLSKLFLKSTKNDLINNEYFRYQTALKFRQSSIRTYPYDKVASHIVGYVQNVNAEDLKKHKNEGYNSTSVIGRSGIEAAYEETIKRKSLLVKLIWLIKMIKLLKNLCALKKLINESTRYYTHNRY